MVATRLSNKNTSFKFVHEDNTYLRPSGVVVCLSNGAQSADLRGLGTTTLMYVFNVCSSYCCSNLILFVC